MRWSCLLVYVTLAVILPASGQAVYYVERDGIVKPVAEGNPEKEHPDQWQVRLYRQGASQSGRGWGQIIGQSADDAREELQRSRQFQQRFAQFCKDDSQNGSQKEDDGLAYSNALGPIAVYRKTKPAKAKVEKTEKKASEPDPPESEAFDLADRISELEKDFLAVTDEKRVKKNPSRYPFAPASAPWNFANKLAQTKKQFEQLPVAAFDGPPPGAAADAVARVKAALTDLETNLLPPMRKLLADLMLDGQWKHAGFIYTAARSGNQLSLAAEDPDALRFRNITIEGDATLKGEIQFIYDNGCEPVWVPFTAELTFDTDAEGILISVPRVGRKKTTCEQVTQGTMRMMFWRPEE